MSREKILAELRRAAQKGDRAALTLALDQMRTLALSPRYWERYLVLLRNPLARLVDLLTLKQGERIARQKGWKLPRLTKRASPPRRQPSKARPERGRKAAPGVIQPSLFEM